ncbi:hypothetical protein AeRB84_012268, partial [Aphanomyces euteiches]
KCASHSTRNAKLSPPATVKKEERGLLKAPVAKQPTTNSQSTLRQRAVVNNESNLVQKKADQIQARLTPSSHDPTEDEVFATGEKRCRGQAVSLDNNERLDAKNQALGSILEEVEAMAWSSSHIASNSSRMLLSAWFLVLSRSLSTLSSSIASFLFLRSYAGDSINSTTDEMRRERNDAMDELDRVRADLEVAQATVKQLQRVHDLVDDIDL